MGNGASSGEDRAFVPTASSQQAVSPVPASIPSAVIESFCDELQGPLEASVRKLADELYSEMLYNVQDYLKSNAVFNIESAFAASERDRINAWKCLKAVLDSATLDEAKNNARAGQQGYWSEQKAAVYRAQAIEAHRAETQRGSVHESAVGAADAPETSQGTPSTPEKTT